MHLVIFYVSNKGTNYYSSLSEPLKLTKPILFFHNKNLKKPTIMYKKTLHCYALAEGKQTFNVYSLKN